MACDQHISNQVDDNTVPMFHAENDKEQDQISQEFQFLGSAFDDSFEYVAGLFFFQENGPSLGAWYSIDNESSAAFGQFKYYFSEQWDVTLGLRYTEDEKEVTLREEDPRLESSHTASDDWSKFTTDLIVGYQLNDDISFYGKRAEGYNAGVFSIGALNHDDYTDFDVFDTPADPEEITSWEIGMKSEWFAQRTLGTQYSGRGV